MRSKIYLRDQSQKVGKWASETSLRGVDNGLVRLVSEEVKIGQEFNSQNWSQKGKKLASETSLRGVENGFVRLVSDR